MLLPKGPMLFLYSITLPLIWFGVGFALDMIAPEIQLGMFGLIAIVYLTMSLICWRFASQFKRHFNKSEKIRLAIYLTLWAVACESLALISLVGQPEHEEYFVDILLFSLAFATVVDAIIMSLAVHFVGNKLNDFFMKKQPTNALVQD